MTSGGSDLQGTFHTLLPFHVGKVELKLVLLCIELLARVQILRFVSRRAIEELDDIHQRLHTIDLQLIDNRCLADVLSRNDEPLKLLLTSFDGYGQRTTDRLQMTVKS